MILFIWIKMDTEILTQLEKELYKKYKSLNNGFMFIEIYDGIIVLNWNNQNDLYINQYRVNQIKTFMAKYLKDNKQEGFFYTALDCIRI